MLTAPFLYPFSLLPQTFRTFLRQPCKQSLWTGEARIEAGTVNTGAGLKVSRGYCRLVGKRLGGSAPQCSSWNLMPSLSKIFDKVPVSFRTSENTQVFQAGLLRADAPKNSMLSYDLKQILCSYNVYVHILNILVRMYVF